MTETPLVVDEHAEQSIEAPCDPPAVEGRSGQLVVDSCDAALKTSSGQPARGDLVRVSNGRVTVYLTPDEYDRTSDTQLRRLLLD